MKLNMYKMAILKNNDKNILIWYNNRGDDMKRFNMIDENFICESCGKEVSPLGYTARDHCPYCLYSKHVDIMPGDRSNSCHGLLEPIKIEKFKNTYKIIYKCQKCHELHKNIIANDDDINLIIELSKNP